jgi:hypothetical protein
LPALLQHLPMGSAGSCFLRSATEGTCWLVEEQTQAEQHL